MKSTQLFGDDVPTYVQAGADINTASPTRTFNAENFTAVMDTLTKGASNIITAVGVSKRGGIPQTQPQQPFTMQKTGDPIKTAALVGGSVVAAIFLSKMLR